MNIPTTIEEQQALTERLRSDQRSTALRLTEAAAPTLEFLFGELARCETIIKNRDGSKSIRYRGRTHTVKRTPEAVRCDCWQTCPPLLKEALHHHGTITETVGAFGAEAK